MPITPFHPSSSLRLAALALALATIAGCSALPSAGPATRDVTESDRARPGTSAIQLVDLTPGIVHQLKARANAGLAALGDKSQITPMRIGPGDSLEIAIWEAPPATLFGGTSIDFRATNPGARPTVIPEQLVTEEGLISVPFAGQIQVTGKTLRTVESEIAKRLAGKANQPEVIARLVRTNSTGVTVVGDVGTATRFPILIGRERVLDAIAAAGGVRQPVSKVSVQLTRGKELHSTPLEAVIRDPRQNVLLQPGDVVTAMFQPSSFTALGATLKNEEIAFEAQGISLAQALGRVGGLNDMRADARGVFVFRFEPEDRLEWSGRAPAKTADGRVPVVYQIDLANPANFFLAQDFTIQNKDVVYVASAPANELQKFLNLIVSGIYPIASIANMAK